MQLVLYHGRKKPDENLEDWGEQGPVLFGVTGLHQTYGNPAHIFFKTKELRQHAQAITNWRQWDELGLQMKWCDDMVECGDEYGPIMYYGDWELQQ